jgi:hypothetical protein
MAQRIYTSLSIQTASQTKYYNTANTFFVALRAPSAQASDVSFVLPGADVASGVWTSDGSGNLSIAKVVDANIASAAAIAVTKLAALTASRAVVSDGSGFISASTTTSTEVGYLSGVTSAIQTQLDGKASTALSNLTVSGLAAQDLLVASSSSAVTRLAVGSNGQVLSVVAGVVAWATPAAALTSFKSNWVTGDGTTLAITHSLGTLDCMVQVYDKTDGATIQVDVERTSTSVVTVSASEAPPAAGWRVLIIAL